MFEYKDEIRASRFGCLGSSDGKMLKQIAELGNVPRSAYKRLAVVKGLLEQTEIPETAAIRMGNETEMQIYEHLKATDERWQSNVRLESKDFSTPNCKLISHPDFLLKDDEHKTLFVCECKATKNTIEQARAEYSAQLFIHYVLAREWAINLGKGWKVKMSLVHYDTRGLNLNEYNEFDTNRLTIRSVRPTNMFFDIHKAMSIVNVFLGTFTEYYEDGEEIPYEILPANVQNQFDSITTLLTEIKEREDKVAAFKSKLYDFLTEKNIKSIKNNDWSIVRIDPTESVQFDNKRYLEDFSIEHPRQYKKIRNKYDKVVKKKGYVSIKIKDKKS